MDRVQMGIMREMALMWFVGNASPVCRPEIVL